MSERPRTGRTSAWRERLRTAEAAACLAAASLTLRVVRFERIAAMARRRPRTLRAGEPADRTLALSVARAVVGAAGRLPWRTACFARGLACQAMLRRRGVPALLHYGARPIAGEGLEAHVWVSAWGVGLVGAPEAPGFAELEVWPHPTGAPVRRPPA